MTVFPNMISSVTPKDPFFESIQFRTIESEYENGDKVTKQKWLFPRRSINLTYYGKTTTEIKTLWQFYLGRKGKHLPFSLFWPYVADYDGEYVGTGDGSTTLFNLPSLDAGSYKVYLSGTEMTSGADYTFTAENGPDGEDTVQFTSAPEAGVYITFDFTGYLKVRCKFADDVMDFETFYFSLAHTGLKLQGLLNA